jgi:Outer membrane protein Omp28/Secretion system C-terminal sorting domain
MRKILLFFVFACTILVVKAQTFTDDFEAYAAGDPIAATSDLWETWSSANGGADDANVVTSNAHSGSNSLYFASTLAGGGPQDVVLPFPGELQVGQFNFEMWMYVNTDAGAYFNFQSEDVIGTTWAGDIYFTTEGFAQFTSGGSLLLSASYPQGAWFKLRMENDLSTNTWSVSIDDNAVGSYSNGETQIASIDIYPLQGNQFYIDDVSYEFVEYTVPANNGAVTNILNMGVGLAGQNVTPSVEIRNLGTSAINSFDLAITYDGTTYNQSVTGVNIASLAFYTVAFADVYVLSAGNNPVTATISNINGSMSDDNADDDTKTINLNPIVPATGKRVVAEEGTGTWCPWCVRGAVYMDLLSERYGEFYIGIAVHNADPMTVEAYDAAIGGLISGYPSGLVDRGPEYDPSQFEIPFLERIQMEPKAFIQNGATWDVATRTLQVSATSTFQQTVTGDYKIALVLTEDNVTGTASGYAQANAYAGGNNGAMGGYEDLPSPVPANQMEYDHVARVISPSFAGLPNAFMGMMDAGDVNTHNFSFVLPAEWDENNLHIVAMVIAPDGTIDNAFSSTITEAVNNGFVAGVGVVGITETFAPDAAVRLYPNPTKGDAQLALDFESSQKTTVEVFDANGHLVVSKYYGALQGHLTLPLMTPGWPSGIYMIKVMTEKGYSTHTLIKE